MREHLLDLLEEKESAPSAVHLLAGELGETLDYEPYEASEGFNDSKRKELMDKLTDAQVQSLVKELEDREW